MKRTLKIVLAMVALAIVGLVVAVVVPSLPSYHFASVSEARSFGHFDDAEIVDELGDTNGPYRLKGGVGGGSQQASFDFDLTFDLTSTTWRVPASRRAFLPIVFNANSNGTIE